ncbi:unnamed protein product [Eruca vesicaria subsp. sativa]|uniref:Uncharacterized protein n=1 Tax=Eruca vesicaria subsp. sativa TaxID=29727 RepID=A0ABC8JK55_ERUVS|nr:unnamed protein product [Eruca vesicaria subsp. sativa]
MPIAKPHLERVQVVLEPYTKNARHGFKKLAESTKVYHQHVCIDYDSCYLFEFNINKLALLKTKAQAMLKNNEITKPVATMDLAWVRSPFCTSNRPQF